MIYKITQKIIKISFWSCLIFCILFVLIYFFCAKQVGILEAKYDIYRGHYEIRSYGLYSYTSPSIKNIDGVKIEYKAVAGCIVNNFIIDSVEAYNETMKKKLKDDFGID